LILFPFSKFTEISANVTGTPPMIGETPSSEAGARVSAWMSVRP
jgi:hypothetical protein